MDFLDFFCSHGGASHKRAFDYGAELPWSEAMISYGLVLAFAGRWMDGIRLERNGVMYVG